MQKRTLGNLEVSVQTYQVRCADSSRWRTDDPQLGQLATGRSGEAPRLPVEAAAESRRKTRGLMQIEHGGERGFEPF